MRWLVVFGCLCFSFLVSAQYDTPAKFPGGDEAYDTYLANNLKFPQQALDSQASREIRALVRVDTFGRLVLESFVFENSGLGFEKEVERFIKSMPNWVPAVHNGQTASTQIILTFTFNYVDPDLEYDEGMYEYYLGSDADQLPEFKEGMDSACRFLKEFLVGELQLSFDTAEATFNIVVDANGKMLDVSILANNGTVADGYWVHAVKNMPPWQPGILDGKAENIQREVSFNLTYP